MKQTIIVPVDGASHIKLEVYDFDTLACLHSEMTSTPVSEFNGLKYNETEREFAWFDQMIRGLPEGLRQPSVIAPVARGASGGMVGHSKQLAEVPGRGITLSYTQQYSERVESAFAEIVGDEVSFFNETGSIRDLPGSLTLLKRFVFEEIERPEVVERTSRFAAYGALMAGHFLDDYLKCVDRAGNEHGYWMCHSGARDINASPGTPSAAARNLSLFNRLVPSDPSVVYRSVGAMPFHVADRLCLKSAPLVIPGGHDTCVSHLPVASAFVAAAGLEPGSPVIHLDAGSWTMIARIGGMANLPADAHKRDIIVQGTVDGEPVVTARYGGGHDFKAVGELLNARGLKTESVYDDAVLRDVLTSSDAFILPNINPVCHGSGPFPALKGRVINADRVFACAGTAAVYANLMTAIVSAIQIDAVAGNGNVPVVLTAGGSKDPYFGRFVATLTGRNVYALVTRDGRAVSETTSLGATICGKAAVMGIHPHNVDLAGLGLDVKRLEPLGEELYEALERYRRRFMDELEKNM